jgi:tetratricopeptide (TPR) repeat protein
MAVTKKVTAKKAEGKKQVAGKKTVVKKAATKRVAVDVIALEELLESNRPSEVLEKLVSLRTKDAKLWFLTGEAHRQLGSFENALKSYAKGLNIAEEAEVRMDTLLAMAACYRTLGHSAAAYELAEETLQMAQELKKEIVLYSVIKRN